MGNVTVVQAFTRLSAEAQGLRDRSTTCLNAQYPVLNWWAVLTVLTKAASTVAMVGLFALGAALHAQGQITVGEIVAFIGFAQLLIIKLEQLSGLINNIFFQIHAIREYFEVLDTVSVVQETPGAQPLQVTRGEVRFQNVSYHYPNSKAGISDIDFTVAPGETVALVGPTGSGKSTAISFLNRVRDPELRRDPDRRPGHLERPARLAAPVGGRGVPGCGAVQPLDPREPARRQAGRDRPGAPARDRPRRGGRLRALEARRARHSS